MEREPRRVRVRFTIGREEYVWPWHEPREWEETLEVAADVWRDGVWYFDNVAADRRGALSELLDDEWSELRARLREEYERTADAGAHPGM
jgi:hypothetical protein